MVNIFQRIELQKVLIGYYIECIKLVECKNTKSNLKILFNKKTKNLFSLSGKKTLNDFSTHISTL